MPGRGQAKRVRASSVMTYEWVLPVVSSIGGRYEGELHLEFPLRAHRITTPLLRSELESLQGLWITEKYEISLVSGYPSVNASPNSWVRADRHGSEVPTDCRNPARPQPLPSNPARVRAPVLTKRELSLPVGLVFLVAAIVLHVNSLRQRRSRLARSDANA